MVETCNLQTKVSLTELEKVKELAADQNRSVSNYVRTLIVEKIKEENENEN